MMFKGKKEIEIFKNDEIQTGSDSKAFVHLTLQDDRINLFSGTFFKVGSAEANTTEVTMKIGKAKFKIKKPKKGKKRKRRFRVRTANAVIGVKGTEFLLGTGAEETNLVTIEGEVGFSSNAAPNIEVSVEANQASRVSATGAPTAPSNVPPTVMSNLLSSDSGKGWNQVKFAEPVAATEKKSEKKAKKEEKKAEKKEEKKEKKEQAKKEQPKKDAPKKSGPSGPKVKAGPPAGGAAVVAGGAKAGGALVGALIGGEEEKEEPKEKDPNAVEGEPLAKEGGPVGPEGEPLAEGESQNEEGGPEGEEGKDDPAIASGEEPLNPDDAGLDAGPEADGLGETELGSDDFGSEFEGEFDEELEEEFVEFDDSEISDLTDEIAEELEGIEEEIATATEDSNPIIIITIQN